MLYAGLGAPKLDVTKQLNISKLLRRRRVLRMILRYATRMWARLQNLTSASFTLQPKLRHCPLTKRGSDI